jgi:hypothetical protein
MRGGTEQPGGALGHLLHDEHAVNDNYNERECERVVRKQIPSKSEMPNRVIPIQKE